MSSKLDCLFSGNTKGLETHLTDGEKAVENTLTEKKVRKNWARERRRLEFFPHLRGELSHQSLLKDKSIRVIETSLSSIDKKEEDARSVYEKLVDIMYSMLSCQVPKDPIIATIDDEYLQLKVLRVENGLSVPKKVIKMPLEDLVENGHDISSIRALFTEDSLYVTESLQQKHVDALTERLAIEDQKILNELVKKLAPNRHLLRRFEIKSDAVVIFSQERGKSFTTWRTLDGLNEKAREEIEQFREIFGREFSVNMDLIDSSKGEVISELDEVVTIFPFPAEIHNHRYQDM